VRVNVSNAAPVGWEESGGEGGIPYIPPG